MCITCSQRVHYKCSHSPPTQESTAEEALRLVEVLIHEERKIEYLGYL